MKRREKVKCSVSLVLICIEAPFRRHTRDVTQDSYVPYSTLSQSRQGKGEATGLLRLHRGMHSSSAIGQENNGSLFGSGFDKGGRGDMMGDYPTTDLHLTSVQHVTISPAPQAPTRVLTDIPKPHQHLPELGARRPRQSQSMPLSAAQRAMGSTNAKPANTSPRHTQVHIPPPPPIVVVSTLRS